MKMIKNSLKIILLLIIIISIFTPKIYAATVQEVFDDADNFMSGEIDNSVHISVKESSIQTLSKVISGVLIAVGVVVAFIMIAIMGINVMIKSVEEKAKIKEALIPFLIGAIITFGAFGIWRVAISLLSEL